MPSHLQSRSFNRKRRVRTWWIVALSLIIVITALYTVTSLTRLSAFAITDVQIFGADQDILGSLRTSADAVLAGNYIGLFPHSNSLIYPRKGIIAAIKTASPRIDDVAVSRDGLHKLMISVNEKIPAAIICVTLPDFDDAGDIQFDSPESCYAADDSGFIFKKSPPVPGRSFHIYYVPDLVDSASPDPVGLYATSTAEFKALQSFYAGTQAAGVPSDAILIKKNGEYELYAGPAVIYFNDMQELTDELANLGSFWKHMTVGAPSNATSTAFDYIDLRYGSNVFYKSIK